VTGESAAAGEKNVASRRGRLQRPTAARLKTDKSAF